MRIQKKSGHQIPIVFFSVFLFALSVSALWAAEKVYVKGRGDTDILYRFSEHLGEAKARIRYERNRADVQGEWEGEYFEFEKMGSSHRVGIHEGSFEAENHRAIYAYAANDSKKILTFPGIQTPSKIVLSYGIDDTEVIGKEPSQVYLRIWIGKQLIKRLRIPRAKGWKQEILDLGVVPFLNQPVSVTFDAMTDNPDGQFFYFDAVLI